MLISPSRRSSPCVPCSHDDIQPRSAVISRKPGEAEAVEKFKQHARKHTHMHMHLHTQSTAGKIMGCVLIQGCHRSQQVTVKEHTLRLQLLISEQHTHTHTHKNYKLKSNMKPNMICRVLYWNIYTGTMNVKYLNHCACCVHQFFVFFTRLS